MRQTVRLSLVGYALFVFMWSLNTHGKNSAVGDEPHYLTVARSLVQDHDLDVSNNYEAGGLQPELHARAARDGRLKSTHDIGLPVLLAPLYAVAEPLSRAVPLPVLQRFRMTRGLFTYAVVSLGMLAATAVFVVVLARALAMTTTKARAMTVAAAVAFSPPVMSHSSLLFPEPIAFMAACAVVWWVRQPEPPAWSSWALAAMLGLLPWCHRKFSLFVIACAVAIVVMRWEYWRRWSIPRAVAVLAVFVVPHAAFHWWTLTTWGNIGGPQMIGGVPFTASGFIVGLAGLLIDRQSGLLAYSPIYIPIGAWWLLARGRTRWLIVPVLSLLLPMSAYETWWAGFAPAARYLMPIVPFCAVVAADSLQFPAMRRVFIALLVVEVPIVLYAWQHPRLLWPDGEGNPLLVRLGPAGRLYERFLPSLHFGSVRDAVVPAAILIATNLLVVGICRMRGRRPAAGQI